MAVPGRDVKWDMGLLWDYLVERSRTCKLTSDVGADCDETAPFWGDAWVRVGDVEIQREPRGLQRNSEYEETARDSSAGAGQRARETARRGGEVHTGRKAGRRHDVVVLSGVFTAGVSAAASRRPSPPVRDRDATHRRRHAFWPISREGLHR